MQKADDTNAATPRTGSPVMRVPHARAARKPSTLTGLLALSALLAGSSALAEPTGLGRVELERLTLNPAGTGSLLLGTGELLQKGGWRLSLTGQYEHNPLVLSEGGTRLGSVVEPRVTGTLAGAYGLTRWLELSAQVPVLLMQRGDDLTAYNLGQPSGGLALGTPYLGLKLGLLSQQDRGDAVDLAVGVNAGLPLGSADALARDSGVRLIPSVMVGRDFGPLRAGVDAGVLLRPRTALSSDAQVGDEVGSGMRLGAALSTTGDGLRGELDAIASVPFASREGASVEALAGARLPLTSTLEGYAMAGVGFGSAPGTPSFRGLLGVAYGSRPAKCIAGGKHTVAQCPDLDDDQDGVRNGSDACPTEGGTVDAQGCPVKDGSANGDSVKDTDHDGLVDGQDKCPTEPGPAERQGCLVPDTDHDGLADGDDKCPTEPGPAELRGCPPKDTDGDVVFDHEDECPTVKGPSFNRGCPVQSPKPTPKKATSRVEMPEPVYFATNKATILPRSFGMLNQLAKLLSEHSELEKLWIEGHTDNTGPAAYNLGLSQRRSDAVRDYLMQKGINGKRLGARGFGEEHPIATNKTPQGRAANRRVEFRTQPSEDTPRPSVSAE